MPRQMTSFQYHPLVHEEREIRVVRIVPRNSSADDIHLKLEHVHLEDNGHVCLSYTWGEAISTRAITLNGFVIEVRSQLAAFLTIAKRQCLLDWLWIDAICIDQANDDEKVRQIRLMKDIYSLAKHVLVFPGEIPLRYSNFLQAIIDEASESRPVFHDAYSEFFVRRGTLWANIADFINALPYWRRAWIVQEVTVAKSAWIVCPEHTLNWVQLESALQKVKIGSRKRTLLPLQRFSPIRKAQSSDLPELLLKLWDNECSIWRDRVYALLGLVDVPKTFPIDYAREDMVVLLDVLQYFVLGSSTSPRPDCLCDDLFNTFIGLRTWPALMCMECCATVKRNDYQFLLAFANSIKCSGLTESQTMYAGWFAEPLSNFVLNASYGSITSRKHGRSFLNRRRMFPISTGDHMHHCCVCDKQILRTNGIELIRHERLHEALIGILVRYSPTCA